MTVPVRRPGWGDGPQLGAAAGNAPRGRPYLSGRQFFILPSGRLIAVFRWTATRTHRGVRHKGGTVRNYDLEFLKRFSLVIGFLAVLSLGLIVGARMVSNSLPYDEPASAAERTVARIAPVGAVYAGSTGAAAAAAAASAAAASASSQVAYGGTLDGSVIFEGLCTGCHGSGAGGAPMMVKAQWTARVAQGMDTLHKHAIEGYTGSAGLMPAKGGNPALTDEQVIASVDWMIDNLK